MTEQEQEVLEVFQETASKWQPQYTEIFESWKSDKAFEEIYTCDEHHETNGTIHRFIPNTYALGVEFTFEEWEDEHDKCLHTVRDLAFSMLTTKEVVAANVLNRAFNELFRLASGEPMCSTSHCTPFGNTFSNRLRTPTDLCSTVLEEVCNEIENQKDSRNRALMLQPKTLVVHPNQEMDAIRAVRKTNTPIEKVVVNNYLSDPDAWFVLIDVPGLIHFDRQPPTILFRETPERAAVKIEATERYSFGCFDPRAVFGVPGTGDRDLPHPIPGLAKVVNDLDRGQVEYRAQLSAEKSYETIKNTYEAYLPNDEEPCLTAESAYNRAMEIL